MINQLIDILGQTSFIILTTEKDNNKEYNSQYYEIVWF